MPNYKEYMDKPVSGQIKALTDLVEEMKQAEQDMKAAETNLDKAKSRYEQLRCVDIPNMLDEIGMHKLTLSNGISVELKDVVRARIDPKKARKALKWLQDNDYGHLIKNGFKVEFGLSSTEKANSFKQSLEENGIEYANNSTVHHSRLTAFVRQQMEEGDLPEEAMDLLSVFHQRQTKLG